MERTCVIVAFGDVSGFNPWIRRGANAPETIQNFIHNFYAEMEIFTIANKDCQIKYLGDGFMVIKELSGKCTRGTCAVKFVKDIARLSRRMAHIVKKCEFPPPEGFRVRLAYGHVSRIQVLDPVDVARKRKIWEYVGYAVNLAQKLLEVAPNVLFILHESAIKAIGRQKTGFRVRRFVGAKQQPRGVDPEDIDGLWVGEL